MSVTNGGDELEWCPISSSLVFFAGLSGVWEREEAGLEKGDDVGPPFFHSCGKPRVEL